ncbi:hypothetical protein NI456_01375 [Brevundimonas diminuta]|uniref:hypothetical protein n=1 Tax=Brevundimonas diminuta TaxID=293 RepID=UPI002096BF7D|nr:hypothetical protein [Brevundimonas diminuta]MCO8017499.1 hypothetical protein [Brevundimonas diminuta]MCO8021019.1 hypothetical protein [Brevundimonas diminuta]
MATVTINLAALERMAEEKAVKGIQRAALAGEAITKANLSRPGSGRIYGKHQASAPGEPPAVDTGRLRNATQADTQVRRDGDDIVGRVVANDEKAHALEVGTERMAPRPFLGLLATDHVDDLLQAFIEGAKE